MEKGKQKESVHLLGNMTKSGYGMYGLQMNINAERTAKLPGPKKLDGDAGLWTLKEHAIDGEPARHELKHNQLQAGM